MDTIIADDPACGFTSINYLVHEIGTYSGVDLLTIGITTDNSVNPPNLQIDTTIAAQTLQMQWWAEPEVTQSTI